VVEPSCSAVILRADRRYGAHPQAPGITDVNRLIGIAPTGEAFEFAVNRLNDSELAGACFSASGRTMFVNVFGNGPAAAG
jgi:secreted PhoX family phosphatase